MERNFDPKFWLCIFGVKLVKTTDHSKKGEEKVSKSYLNNAKELLDISLIKHKLYIYIKKSSYLLHLQRSHMSLNSWKWSKSDSMFNAESLFPALCEHVWFPTESLYFIQSFSRLAGQTNYFSLSQCYDDQRDIGGHLLCPKPTVTSLTPYYYPTFSLWNPPKFAFSNPIC